MDSLARLTRHMPGTLSSLVLVASLLICCGPYLTAQTQQAILVAGYDGSLDVFDLATAAPIESVLAGSLNKAVAVGPNPRLAAMTWNQGPISLVDLTLQREIGHLLFSGQIQSLAFTTDGRFLLVPDPRAGTLDMVDAPSLRLLRKVSLASALGSAARQQGIRSVVTLGRKAYVIAQPSSVRPTIAEVDLGTFRVRPISIISGYLSTTTLPVAAITPDGKYLVMIEQTNTSYQLLFINTLTLKVTNTTVLPNFGGSTPGVVITPNGTDPTKIYGYVLHRGNASVVLTAIDLRPGSHTFSQLVPGTDVPVPFTSISSAGLAISTDGARLVAGGQQFSQNNPLPNLFVVDTSALLAGQGANSIVATAIAAGGGTVGGIAVAPISVAVPPTAPTVTQVSSNVTNDTSTVIDVFGSNFAHGAQVRIGSFGPLATTFVSATDLKVTVPQNTPAGAAQDVIVTNPGPRNTPALQNQSGLLAGGITVAPNPAFQPQYPIAVLNSDNSIGVYNSSSQSISRFQANPVQSSNSILFNFDGAELYTGGYGPLYNQSLSQVLQWRLSDDSLQATIPLPQTLGAGLPLATSVNPATGRPVLYVPQTLFNYPHADLVVSMVDVDPTSPTFNTVLATIPAGLTTNAFYFGAQLAATPDGKYVYIVYGGTQVGSGYGLASFDIVHQTATTADLGTFGAATYQGPIQVTADGRWLLIHSVYANYAGSGIAVCDLSQPTNPTLVGTVNGSQPGSTAPMFFWSFQAVGNRLFAADSYSNAVLAFNFDPVHRDFTQLGVTFVPAGRIGSFMAVTPDGALAYIAGLESESISVLDANALANGQPSLITVLANGTVPAQVAVSPIAGPSHMHPTGNPRRNVTPIGPSRSSLGPKSL
jgi:hypothetical protein